MKKHTLKASHQKSLNKGFTLIELLIVIAIIGILASVVLVSSQSSVSKAKRVSALTTASSVLPELVTCQDDGGNIVGPVSATVGGGTICSAAGHTTAWPDISKTSWLYGNVGVTILNANISTMTFTLTKSGETTITCTYASNGCT